MKTSIEDIKLGELCRIDYTIELLEIGTLSRHILPIDFDFSIN